jgi:hypothetical protein
MVKGKGTGPAVLKPGHVFAAVVDSITLLPLDAIPLAAVVRSSELVGVSENYRRR